MENNIDLLTAIVKRLVEAETVEIVEVPLEGEEGVLLEIVVPDNQKGRVIGKQGRTIQALRTVFGAVGAREGRLVKVDLRMESPPPKAAPAPLEETDDAPAADDEPATEDEPAVYEAPATEDEPTVDDESAVEDEPTVDSEAGETEADE